jgi:hypothetical protein
LELQVESLEEETSADNKHILNFQNNIDKLEKDHAVNNERLAELLWSGGKLRAENSKLQEKIAISTKENNETKQFVNDIKNKMFQQNKKDKVVKKEFKDGSRKIHKLKNDQINKLKSNLNDKEDEIKYRDHAHGQVRKNAEIESRRDLEQQSVKLMVANAHGQLRRNAQIESQRDLEQQNVKLMVANGDRKYLQEQIGDLNQEIVNMERTSGLGPFVDYKINYGDKDGLSNNIFIGENTLLEEKYAQLREKYDVMKTKIDDESDAKSTLGSTTNSTTSGDDHLKNDVAIDTKPSKVKNKRTQKDDEQIKELIEGLNKSQADLHKIENNINTQQDEQIKRLQKQDKTIKDLTNDLTAQNIDFVKDVAKQYVTTTEQNIEHKNQINQLNKELDWQEHRNGENYKKIEHLTNKKPINKKKSMNPFKNLFTISKKKKKESKKDENKEPKKEQKKIKITRKNLQKQTKDSKKKSKKVSNEVLTLLKEIDNPPKEEFNFQKTLDSLNDSYENYMLPTQETDDSNSSKSNYEINK